MDIQNSETQVGTVQYFEQHFFVSTPNADWPTHVETMGYVETLNRLLLAYDQELDQRLKMTAFHDPKQGETVRILCFPSQIEYRVLPGRLGAWAEAYFKGDRFNSEFLPSLIVKRWVFVCAHGTRDQRCGDCGPPIIAAVKESFGAGGHGIAVEVAGTSHVGGHKYAGNVLIYPEGDWYGSLKAADIPRLVKAHFGEGKILWEFWRGRAGLNHAEQAALASVQLDSD